jgi:deoxyribose-phosphate aldolase
MPPPSTAPLSAAELAAIVDHTLLAPEAVPDEIAAHCAEAVELGVFAVCVPPTMVPLAVAELSGTPVRVATVIGFPSGAHTTEVKAVEAELAVADGAEELDMVINLALARAGAWDLVRDGIAIVRSTAPDATLKVIIESAVLSGDEIVAACQAAEDGGAQFVKTSTGAHPAGGATAAAVKLMAQSVGPHLGVKASGGIASAATALELIAAGATRLGLSRTRAVLAELAG